MRRTILAILVASATLAGRAHAQPAQDNAATVEGLFAEGKRLASERKWPEACAKFRASYTLEVRLGTLLNLADCYEKTGQLASAWARFVEAQTLASRSGQTEREQFARDHVALLEPRLSRLTIAVPKPILGLVVKRDGVVVDPGSYGSAVPVDPGSHELAAEAPGKKPWSRSIVVGDNADAKTAEVPALAEAPRPKDEPPPGGSSKRALAGVVTAGVGVVALGVGAYFGFAALGKNDDSKAYCNIGGDANACTRPGLDLRHDAVTYGTVSSVLVGVGIATVAAGAVLWFTAPSSPVTASARVDGRSVRIEGGF